jgi:TolB-like protein/Tfp pilus assembly protein PilF
MTMDLREQLQRALGDAYIVEAELGGGGMSRVFAAEERSLGRRVVVKVLPPDLAGAVSAERFRREIRFAARLQHPHIVPLLTAGAAGARGAGGREAGGDGLLFYTMPFVDGESLRERLGRSAPLPIAEAVRIMRDVADALTYAHDRGIIHRDIKPANVLVSGEHALVADFGLAKALDAAAITPGAPLSTAGVSTGPSASGRAAPIVGTPAYMAPEQLVGDPAVDHRADIYALGVLGYEMLSGTHPFAESPLQSLIAAPEPIGGRRPDAPTPLAALITRCLEKDPARRPQTAEEVVRELDRLSAALQGATPAPRSRTRRARRVAAYVAASAALLALAGYAIVTRQSDRAPAAGRPAIRSVAVLPFANLSADREDEYLADGMTEELINALTKVEGLRVPARTSSFAFKGKNMSVRVIADSLHVGSVLAGSVRKAGNRLRVTAQLVGAADGYHLWSETYERDLKDVFAVQDEIARAITGALRAKLAAPDSARMVGRPTQDLEAYTLFLRGRHLWNRRTAGDLRKAIDYYERAIARDPQFARAHAALAEAYAVLPEYSTVLPLSAYAKARASATRALALDSSLAEAYTALADVQMMHDWDWAASKRTFQRAIALNPSYAPAHTWYGLLLLLTGSLDESLAEMKRAKDLDPLSPIIGTALGFVLYQLGRSDAAIEEERRTLELDPDFARAHDRLGLALLEKGLHDEAIREAERAVELDPGSSQYAGTLAYVLAASGERDRAVPHLRDLQARARREYTSPGALAVAHLALGQRDSAFAWLDRAAQARDPLLLRWLRSPVMAPLRSDARFARLLRLMGLAR